MQCNPEKTEIKPAHNEKTLAELGFDSEISDWDKSEQPRKSDKLELLKRMIISYNKPTIQVHIGSSTYNCHLLLLQCYSDYFMKLTYEEVIFLAPERVTPEAFVIVYDWMIATKPKLQRERIIELFAAAEFLGIKGLVEQCWVCLDDDKGICEDEAFVLYMEARKYGCEIIQQLLITRICKFFLTLVASKEFVELSPKEICELLKSNSIAVNGEIEVFMAAVRWLNFNWTDREKYMIDVMKCVRFGLMTPWQINILSRDPESPEILKITKCEEVQQMLQDGLSYFAIKYWNVDSENLAHDMERLDLVELIERQWVRDKMFTDNFKWYDLSTSFKQFVEYLMMIKQFEKNHWKTLVYCEEL